MQPTVTPPGHRVQLVHPTAPRSGAYAPVAHLTQAVAPAAGAYAPAAQLVHRVP